MQIFFFFFLLLSLTATISAQIIPVDSTRTSVLDATSGIKIIEIATPNINNISNNTYSQFNIAAAGVILNNSSITSTSQLTGGNITGNSNITTGSEASLILNQVTSNNTSLLAGIVEVVGTKDIYLTSIDKTTTIASNTIRICYDNSSLCTYHFYYSC